MRQLRTLLLTALVLAVALPIAPLEAATLNAQFSALVAKEKLPLSNQAVCITGPQGTIVSRNATMRIIPASVSKLYTFDWALSTLPSSFRYTTNVYLSGTTLYINGGGDPHFVIEQLRDVFKTVDEDKDVTITKIVFSPNFFFNWKTDPKDVAASLRTTLTESKRLDPSFPLSSSFTVTAADAPYKGRGARYQFKSMPLPSLIKQVSDYSTNISADILFAKLGGKDAFSDYMQKTYGVGPESVHFETGSGLFGNYTTCELTLRVIAHLEAATKENGLNITDIMTMPTIDPGVLEKRKYDRNDVRSLVAKSGTVNNHQSLAGIINTAAGSEYFAVFVYFPNVWKIESMKNMIDTFMSSVLKSQRSILKPYNYTPDPTLFKQYKIARL